MSTMSERCVEVHSRRLTQAWPRFTFRLLFVIRRVLSDIQSTHLFIKRHDLNEIILERRLSCDPILPLSTRPPSLPRFLLTSK
jgi:hypothetical protein